MVRSVPAVSEGGSMECVADEGMECEDSVQLDELERLARLSTASRLMGEWTARKCATFVMNYVMRNALILMDRRTKAEYARKTWLNNFYSMDCDVLVSNMSDEVNCNVRAADPVECVLEGLLSLVVTDKMGMVVSGDTYDAHNCKRKRGTRIRWASWRGKFSMRCRNPGNIVRGARRVAVGMQTGQYYDAEQQVKKTSQCGAVSVEILPVCSMDTRSSMKSVRCTPVQEQVKLTGQCGTVSNGVLPVCSMDTGRGMNSGKCTLIQDDNWVQTTSGTTCDVQMDTIDKERIGSNIVNSGVCGSTPVCEDGVAADYCHTEKGEKHNNFSHGPVADGEKQQNVQLEAKNGLKLEAENENARTPPACGSRRKLMAKRMGGRNSKKRKEVPDRFLQLDISQFFMKNKIPAENIKLTGGNIVALEIAEKPWDKALKIQRVFNGQLIN
jgi:hypothetical protein